jgi:DNA-directed RNA polymerase subunit beta'
MLKSTMGQILINNALPEDMRNWERVLDKKGVAALGQELAEKHPDEYRDVMFRLSKIGSRAAYRSNGNSFGLRSIQPAIAARAVKLQLQKEIDGILADPKLEGDARNDALVKAIGAHQKKLVDDVFDESRIEDNPLAAQLMGAGRGNKFSLNSLRGADLLYVDHHGKPIPIPVMHSYSEGLTPAEYFAGAFGARKGVLDLKAGTQDAGFFAKQLTQTAHRLLVTDHDDEDPYDELNPRGYPVDTDDADNEGALLAHPAAGYPRNTRLTPKILKSIRASGADKILVRSAAVGGPADGGVYARDAGFREKARLAPRGDYVGIAAANALSEPVTQATISSKHSGGVAGATAGAVGGFKAINALVQVPKIFPGGAAHAQTDGMVHGIAQAPQGGHYVYVGDQKHYVPVDAPLLVKKGDTVEAGDVLSAGVPNPAEIVKHKGIGEGRRYFVDAFRQTLKDSSTYGNRRNIELVARGLINHVRLNDEIGDWSPDDVVPYSSIERNWQPREGHFVAPPSSVAGHYLEKPVLHYTIGTKIGKKMLEQFKQFGVNQVYAHPEPPPFSPEMIRGMASVSHDPDPMVRGLGSYQSKSFLRAAHLGETSDTGGTSFVPALAEGKDFGLKWPTKGWEP